MEILETLIPEKYLFALGWMIIHALWQIAGIGLILWLVLRFFNQKSAALKYRLSIGALFLVTSLAIGTFFYHIQDEPSAKEFAFNQPEMDHFISQGVSLNASNNDQYPVWKLLTKSIESWIPYMVQFWILGAMLFLIRFGASLADLRNISIKNHEMVDPEWMKILQRQMELLNLKNPIKLLKTVHLDVPITYGIWKPVILIPASLFFQLSPAQLEAILAHELSHIKRYDYLVNLLQSFLEVVFFFHPVFWWINKTARELRENACDDMAIKMGASPNDLAYGLAIVLNHAKNPTPEMVMAAAKTKNPTLERIKRIMGVKTSSSQPTTITSMTMMITLLLGATLIVGASDKPSKESFEDLMDTELNTTTIEGNWIDPYSYPKEDTVPPKSPVKMDLDWDKMTPEQKEKFEKDMEKGLKDLGEFFKDMTPVFEGIGDIGSLFRDFPGTPIPPMDFAIAGIPEFELKDIPMMDFDIAPFITFPDSAWYFEVPSDIYFPADSASVYNFSYRNKYDFDTTKMSKAEIEKKKAIMAEESAKRAAAIEKWNLENKDRIAEWQKKVETWQKEMAPKAEEFQAKMKEWEKANEPKMQEFKLKMEEWQQEFQNNLQPKMEEYQAKMQEWQKANEPKMKEFEQKMKTWQEENQPKIEEFQKKMEIWQQENQEKMKEFQMKMQEWQKENQEKMQQLEKSQKEESKKEMD